jgi:hypothetical protein
MGSAIFRNRYWWYKSLYDDYTGREMRLAFGLCGVLWLPHYWYDFNNIGGEFISTEVCKKTTLIKYISLNLAHVETDLPIVYVSNNLK